LGYLKDIAMAHLDLPSRFERFTLVFSTGSIPEGLLVKGILESEGIPVSVRGEAEGPYRMGPVELWVPDEFEVHARAIVHEARSGDPIAEAGGSDEAPAGERTDDYRLEY
jgi:hypothetical protein